MLKRVLAVAVAVLVGVGLGVVDASGQAADFNLYASAEVEKDKEASTAGHAGGHSEEVRHVEEVRKEVEERKPLEINAAVVGFFQGATCERIDAEKMKGPSGVGFAADFSAAYRPGIGIFENSRLFTRVHVGEGRSADRHLGDNLFANLNTIADNSEIYIEDDDAIAWLPELYLAHEFFDGRLTLVAGKTEALVFIDDNEFANNPYAQFVGKAFVNNPILDAENEFAPIAAATLSPVESFSVSALAVSSSRPGGIEGIRKSVYDKIFDKPMYAAQAAWSPKYQGLQGNYRVYFWNAPYSHVKSTGREGADGWGVGVSLDQQVTERVGLFARAAYGNEDAYDADWFWSVGVNLKGWIPSREKDELGVGVAGIQGCGDRLHRDTEVHLEAYYRILIREYFAISPDIQYVANPVGNSRNDPIVAGMIRVELFY